jgi:hypothetical protein
MLGFNSKKRRMRKDRQQRVGNNQGMLGVTDRVKSGCTKRKSGNGGWKNIVRPDGKSLTSV